ncbi:hypothetical protein SPONN_651 [uncultured Candidatus Thioglobus sp.]|nr:hypothetical protein SPONN_651 [uncultured Candidatus Thioglobus sp.]
MTSGLLSGLASGLLSALTSGLLSAFAVASTGFSSLATPPY